MDVLACGVSWDPGWGGVTAGGGQEKPAHWFIRRGGGVKNLPTACPKLGRMRGTGEGCPPCRIGSGGLVNGLTMGGRTRLTQARLFWKGEGGGGEKGPDRLLSKNRWKGGGVFTGQKPSWGGTESGRGGNFKALTLNPGGAIGGEGGNKTGGGNPSHKRRAKLTSWLKKTPGF